MKKPFITLGSLSVVIAVTILAFSFLPVRNVKAQVINTVGPKTTTGNSDPTNFLWYSMDTIDRMYAAQDIFERFLESKCDKSGRVCGANYWTDVILKANLPAYPNASIASVGFTDDGSDPTTPFLSVDLFCPGGNCDPQYATTQVLAATNTDGMSVQSAMVSWGVSSRIQVDVINSLPTILDQPQPIDPKRTIYVQYFTGTLNNYIGGSHHSTVLGLTFNAQPYFVSGTLYTVVGTKNCREEIAGSHFTIGLSTNSRLLASFHSDMAITGVDSCGTAAHVGDVLTLDGTATCTTSDVHELCKQQFQISSPSGPSGNIMLTPIPFSGQIPSSGGTSSQMSLFKPGTFIPLLPNTYWWTSNGVTTLHAIHSESADELNNDLRGLIGPGQQSAMFASGSFLSGMADIGGSVVIGLPEPFGIGLGVGITDGLASMSPYSRR